jgi:hypothetical protein
MSFEREANFKKRGKMNEVLEIVKELLEIAVLIATLILLIKKGSN